LKALLQELGLPLARTQECEDLLDVLLPHDPELRSCRRGAIFLSDFAVEFRYPGRNATTRQMRAALRWAGRMRESCRGSAFVNSARSLRNGWSTTLPCCLPLRPLPYTHVPHPPPHRCARLHRFDWH
jgi:hypothetical protein